MDEELAAASQDSPSGSKPRYTRKDIHKLPRSMVRNRTKEELEEIWDDEGYLLQPLQAAIDSGITINKCHTCEKPTKSTCASCKMVFYCSPSCQKAHWKAHKPMCKLTRLISTTAPGGLESVAQETQQSLELENNVDFSKMMQDSIDMRKNGRKYGSVRSILRDWLTDAPDHFKHGGSIELSSMGAEHMWAMAREDGKLTLGEEMNGKKRVGVPEGRHGDALVKYISESVEKIARGLNPPVVCIYAETFSKPIMDIAADTTSTFTSSFIRRGAEVTLYGGNRWEVVQFVPELLQRSDRYAAPSMADKRYIW